MPNLMEKNIMGKSIKSWIWVVVTIFLAIAIIVIFANIVRWILEERYRAEKNAEPKDAITNYSGDMLNPFNVIGDIMKLVKG